MKKIILASVSSIALLGLAACSDDDTTTTQSIEPEVQETAPTVVPESDTNVTVVPEVEGEATEPSDTTTTTQSIEIEPEVDATDETTDTPAAAPEGTIDTDEVEPADDVPAVQ